MGLSAWFTASATPQARTIVKADPFDVVLGLRMEDKTVRISVERGGREAPAHLSFDPDTMLIR
jgi:hypothetical protein